MAVTRYRAPLMPLLLVLAALAAARLIEIVMRNQPKSPDNKDT